MMRLWPSIAITATLFASPCLAGQKAVGPIGPRANAPNKMAPRGPGVAAFERLSRMPAAQRQRVLEKLPPERKARVESRLEEYNNLPQAEKQRLHEQYESFQQLPPEKQDTVRRLYQRFNHLPEERRAPVSQEFQQLRRMSPEERRARINSDEFRNKFTQNEQHLLDHLAKSMPNE